MTTARRDPSRLRPHARSAPDVPVRPARRRVPGRVHQYVAAVAALLLALLLARVAFGPGPVPPATLAVTAPSAGPFGSRAPTSTSTPVPSPSAPAPPAPAPAPPPTLDAVRAALAALDGERAAAFADPLAADPGAWAVQGCACHADDTGALRGLARDGLALRGHRVTVDSVAFAARPTARRADVVLVDRVGAYEAVDGAGRVVRRWPATGPRRWRVTLVRTDRRWVFGAVARAP